MSEFVAQIRAEIDTKQAEQKLKDFTDKEHTAKINLEVDEKASQKGIDKTLDNAQKQTKKKSVDVDINYKENKNSITQLTDSANRILSLFSGNRNLLDLGADKIREAIGQLKELNTILVEIDKSGNLSQTQLSKLSDDSYDAASKWGALIQGYMSSAETFSQAGYSNLEEMADLSTMAQTAGQMTEQTATNFLIASDNAWQMKGNIEKLTSVLDGMNSVTNHNALNMTELANGIRVAGSMLSNSGLAEEQATALIGTGVATTKDSGETVARGLRTIIMNLRQIKGETDDGEIIDTQQLEKAERTCSEVGVSLKTVKDGVMELRNPIDVLRELSEVYNSLDTMDARRASIISDIAGKHRSNILASILTNFDQYDKMLQDYANGEGSAFNEAMKTADSWEGRLHSLSNSWLELIDNFAQADTMKGGISFLDGMVSAMDSLQEKELLLPTLTSAIMGLRSVFSGRGITDINYNKEGKGLNKLDIEGSLFGLNFNSIKRWKTHFADAESEINRWNKNVSLGQTSLKKFGGEFVKQNDNFKDYISTVKDGSASLGGYKAHLQSVGVEFENFNMKSFIANAATGFLATSAIELALAGITTVIDDVIHKQDRLAESATESTTAWSESNNTLQEQINKYKELKSQLDSGTLTPTEEYDTRQQILDIQMQISDQYGEQAANIDLVNGSLQTQLGILQQISSENAKQALNENREEYKNAVEQMTTDRRYILGATGSVNYKGHDDLRKDVEDIAESFEKEGIHLEETGDGSGIKTIFFDGDASQAEETINALMNKIEELKSKYTDDDDSINILDYILDQSAQSLKNNREEILDKHEESYKKFLQMDMLSKGTGKGSAADVFNQYTEAVEKYNEALSSGDQNTINKARSDFATISDEVDNLLSKGENSKYSTLFEDITDQLNTAGIKSMEFQEALSDDSNSKNQFHGLSDGIKDASEGLKFLKLDAVDAMNAIVTAGKQTGESELWTLAEAWGITSESSREEIQGFIDVLIQAGLVSGEVGTSAENASKSFESFSTSVQKTISDYATLKSIMSESVSGAGISYDNVDAFRAMFGADADKALEETANGYHLNRKALGELQAQMGEMTKTDYLSALSDQYTELQNIEAQISTFELLGQDTSGLEASRNGILDNISSLHELQNQYEAATSAYQQWQSAMSGGEEGDMYDSIYGNIDKAKDLYDKGLTGTNKFREFADLMSNKDLSTASNEEIVAAYEDALPKIKRYFTEGQEGAQNFLEDVQNLNSEWVHMNEDGSFDIDFDDQKVADKLGIDVEAVQAIMKKLSDYGFDINLENPTASMKKLKSEAESAEKTLGELGDNVKVDLNADSFEEVDTQISSIKEYIDGIEGSDLELDVKTDKLNAANTILEYLISRKKQLGEKEGVDVEINIDESQLQAGYTILGRLRDNLQNLHGEVDVDTVNVQTAINTCVEQIEAMSPEMKVALGIQGMTTDEIKSGLLDGSIQLPVTADTEKANSDIEKIKSNKIDDKNFSVNANTSQAENSLSNIRNYLSAITSKEITVTVNKVTNNRSTHSTGKGGSPADGGVSVNGTAHAHGTAFANGTWGNPSPGKKLVGELGTEIVVNPHTGRWFTVGDNGAEFVEIPKNAIVFNHKQSESLLKKGYADGRGQSLASGTALVSGTALSGGTGAFNAGGSGSSANSNTSNTIKPNSNNKDKSKSKDKKETKQTFDWIERKLERLQQIIDYTKAKFENLFTIKKKNSNLDRQIKQTNNLLKASQKAEKKYAKKANNVKLSASLKKKVQSGAYNIKNYDEKTAEKINKYKDYYDKRYNAKKKVQELKTQKRELKEQKYQLRVDNSNNRIEMYDAKASLSTDYKKNNRFADKQIAHTKSSYDYQIKIAKLTKDTVKVKTLEAEREKEIIELQKKKFDNIQTYYENQISLLQAKENAIKDQADILEAKGMTLNANMYVDQIYYEKESLEQLQKSKAELESQLAKITEGTEEWYECKSAISDVNSEIADCTKNIANMNSSMTGLADDFHSKMMEAGNRIMDTMDWSAGLMDDKDLFNSETGDITNEGLATLGSYVSNYHTSKGMSDKTRKLIENLESNYNAGNLSFVDSNGLRRSYNSMEEFKAAIEEFYASYRDEISQTHEYESKIIDMQRKRLESELSVLQELIDAKKEALNAEKDLHDYQNSIQEKTKDISTIQKQIAAYTGDTSEEGLAKLQKLQVQLSDKEKDLRETEYDRYISDQEEMLDKLYEEYEKSITAEMQNVEKLLADGIEIAKNNVDLIAEIHDEYTEKYDYNGRFDNIEDGLNHIVNDSKEDIGNKLKDNANEGVAPGTNETTIAKTELLESVKNEIPKLVETVKNAIKLPEAAKKDKPIPISTEPLKSKKTSDKKKEEPKKNSDTPKSSGDGKIKVGDKVKFEKGKYYASSAGTGASGNQKLGKKVYIAKIVKDAKYPYCISTSKNIKDGLGWVKQSQLSGFKTGGIARFVKSKGEDGIGMIRNGEGLIPPENVSQIQDLIDAVPAASDTLKNINNLPANAQIIKIPTTPPNAEFVFNIDMNRVTDPSEFLRTLKTDRKLQKGIQSFTTDKMYGDERLGVDMVR